MSHQLIPIEPSSSPAIPIIRPVLLIGRHRECDFRINLPKISRRHCCVAISYDRILIRDLGSRTGLRVNGRVVEDALLAPGDEIAIGPLLYRLVAVSQAPAPPSRRGPGGSDKPPSPHSSRGDDLIENDLVPLDD